MAYGDALYNQQASSPTGSNLLELRELFIKASQRYDLIVDGDFSQDNGADWYINAAQRYLDLRMDLPWQYRRARGTIAADEVQFVVQDLMTVERLRFTSSGEDWTDITESFKPWEVFHEDYPEQVSEWDTEEPAYWTMNYIGLAPEHGNSLSSSLLDTGDLYIGADYRYTGIKIYPKTDIEYNYEVLGKFFSKRLTAGNDRSLWTDKFPETLLSCALMLNEGLAMRNSQGFQDAYRTLNTLLSEVDDVAVQYEMSGKQARMGF